MKPNPVHRLPAPLEAAAHRVRLAARAAVDRTVESLGLSALASHFTVQRDSLLAAQFELNRKSAVFVLAFNEAFDERVLREVGARNGGPTGAGSQPSGRSPLGDEDNQAPVDTRWDQLSLVDDQEVEAQISAERFGMELAAPCEWELREVNGYIGTLLGQGDEHAPSNPLRPEVVGHAMMRGVHAVADLPEMRKLLAAELSRSLAGLLRDAYAQIVTDWRQAGLQPVGLSARVRASRTTTGGGESNPESRRDSGYGQGEQSLSSGRNDPDSGTVQGSVRLPSASRTRNGGLTTTAGGGLAANPYTLGAVDPALMDLIRRLAPIEAASTSGDSRFSDFGAAALDPGGAHAPLPNLIRANRDELRRASGGPLDHMIIDVIGFLFDQILSDPKVHPQMARQIARLQLPVLRAALGDPGFFASHRHPVRRFVNRIAALGAGLEDFGEDAARQFLVKIKHLVHEVVTGDFEQIALYEQQLAAVEQFVAEQAAQEVRADPAAVELLTQKEDQARLRALYAEQLSGALKEVDLPAFLRDFVSRVWSRVLLRAQEVDGPDGEKVKRLRHTSRELLLSVHPKPTPAQRKAFLADLPKLMQELTEGMNLIGWPEAERRTFFGQLMPAHAEAIRATMTGRQLETNLLARQVDGALERAAPTREDLQHLGRLPVLTEALEEMTLNADEARQVGLVDEAGVNWQQAVDIELDLGSDTPDAATAASLPPLPGVPAPSDSAEPTQGLPLAETVQLGFVYQMNLDDGWRKVRLTHVSPGRSFFVFSYGGRHRQTVSLTQRMLMRLCESGRLRAFESASLIERATLRARRQLAALGAAAKRGVTRH